jgi:hypothetical protein
MFPERFISLRGELPWPTSSPDLSVCDYFLSGYLKAKVYITRPQTSDDHKIAIRKQISAIPENMAKLRANLQEYVRNERQHLSDVLFKTK